MRKVEDRFFGEWLCGICEAFCVKDGVQDDPCSKRKALGLRALQLQREV